MESRALTPVEQRLLDLSGRLELTNVEVDEVEHLSRISASLDEVRVATMQVEDPIMRGILPQRQAAMLCTAGIWR